jgi:hypothetical protein
VRRRRQRLRCENAFGGALSRCADDACPVRLGRAGDSARSRCSAGCPGTGRRPGACRSRCRPRPIRRALISEQLPLRVSPDRPFGAVQVAPLAFVDRHHAARADSRWHVGGIENWSLAGVASSRSIERPRLLCVDRQIGVRQDQWSNALSASRRHVPPATGRSSDWPLRCVASHRTITARDLMSESLPHFTLTPSVLKT